MDPSEMLSGNAMANISPEQKFHEYLNHLVENVHVQIEHFPLGGSNQGKPDRLIARLFVAIEDFIDEMKILDLNAKRQQLEMERDELSKKISIRHKGDEVHKEAGISAFAERAKPQYYPGAVDTGL